MNNCYKLYAMPYNAKQKQANKSTLNLEIIASTDFCEHEHRYKRTRRLAS